MAREERPEKVTLSQEQADALLVRLAQSRLSPQDIEIFRGLVAFNLWLQRQLERAELTMVRLRRFLGFKTEKKTLMET